MIYLKSPKIGYKISKLVKNRIFPKENTRFDFKCPVDHLTLRSAGLQILCPKFLNVYVRTSMVMKKQKIYF